LSIASNHYLTKPNVPHPKCEIEGGIVSNQVLMPMETATIHTRQKKPLQKEVKTG